MKWILNILGVILVLMGLLWILQGVNVLPGTMMSGHIQYTYIGIAVDALGIVLLVLANRRPRLNR
jgi:hypothetical protein